MIEFGEQHEAAFAHEALFHFPDIFLLADWCLRQRHDLLHAGAAHPGPETDQYLVEVDGCRDHGAYAIEANVLDLVGHGFLLAVFLKDRQTA